MAKKNSEKSSFPPREVVVKTKLLFNESGLYGFILEGTNNTGRKVLGALMDSDINGLEYCEEKVIVPHAGGGGEYWIGFRRAEKGV